MSLRTKAFCLAAALAATIVTFSAVHPADAPTVVSAAMVDATMPVCKAAIEAGRKGDSQFLQRAVASLSPGNQGFVYILCTAYARGYADGMQSFPVV